MMTGAEGRVFEVPEEALEFGGGTDWYPTGEYEFTIAEVYTNTLGETDEGEPFQGFVTSDGEQLSVQINNFVPLNGAEDPPSELVSQFIRICTKDGDQDYVTVDPADKDFKQLAKGKRRLVAIAQAIGETPSDSFVEGLRTGDFNGQTLTATFQEWKMGKGTDARKGSFPKKFGASATI